jgi:hypothetical protein
MEHRAGSPPASGLALAGAVRLPGQPGRDGPGRRCPIPGSARVEVSDAGIGQWSSPRDAADDDEYGRGLAIVAALADKLGHDVRAGRRACTGLVRDNSW